jgi:acetolactate synthase-1/2/3 large subunit
MLSIGSFKTIFAGPPVNQQAKDGQGERAAERTTVVA